MKLLLLAVISLGFGCALFCSQDTKIPLENARIFLPLKEPRWNALLEQLQKSQDLSSLSDAADEAFGSCTSLARQQAFTQQLKSLIEHTPSGTIRNIALQEIKEKERRWMSAPLCAAVGAVVCFSLPVGVASVVMLISPCHP